MRALIIALSLLALQGCTYALHLSELNDMGPEIRSKNATRIKAEAEQFAVMGFVTQTDYVNEAYDKFTAKCPGGRIVGVSTRTSTAHGFFSWKNRIRISGWCLGPVAASSSSKKG